jgi:hypothetical protein
MQLEISKTNLILMGNGPEYVLVLMMTVSRPLRPTVMSFSSFGGGENEQGIVDSDIESDGYSPARVCVTNSL